MATDEKNGDSLTATGILISLLDGPGDLEHALLDVRARLRPVGGDHVDVQLERVGAGLLDLLGVARASPSAVVPLSEAMTGTLDRRLDLADLLEVLAGPEGEVVGLREVGERLGEALLVHLHVVDHALLFVGDLLLEQRAQDDGRRAGVLEPLHPVELVGHRRGAGHQRVGEAEAKIRCRQVHLILLLLVRSLARPAARSCAPGNASLASCS